jgi:hypothetical protein
MEAEANSKRAMHDELPMNRRVVGSSNRSIVTSTGSGVHNLRETSAPPHVP